ncbi:MAG: rhomboid family intramembrane serine protease, partial [Planctomycetaceae bacterium]
WGLVPKELAQGNVIGLFTSMFLHGDFMHILGNMIALWAFAWTLENLLGSGRFAVLYFVCGLVGGVGQCIGDLDSEIPCIGASGAVAGLMGAYCLTFGVATRMKTLIWIFRPIVVYVPTCVFAVIWLGMQGLGVLASAPGEPGVAWWAHLGGFLAGMAMMPLLNTGERRLGRDKDGSLTIAQFAKPGETINSETADALEEAEPQPELCDYCGTEVTDATAMAPGLFRCPNPACGRLHLAKARRPATPVRS